MPRLILFLLLLSLFACAGAPKTPSTDLYKIGREAVWGSGAPGPGVVGKGTCPVCHQILLSDLRPKLAPELIGARETAAKRVGSPDYRDWEGPIREAFPKSGRAKNGEEYLVESLVCPSCYVVFGFGRSYSTRSTMPPARRLSLSPEEAAGIVAYLQADGEEGRIGQVTITLEKILRWWPTEERAASAVRAAFASAEGAFAKGDFLDVDELVDEVATQFEETALREAQTASLPGRQYVSALIFQRWLDRYPGTPDAERYRAMFKSLQRSFTSVSQGDQRPPLHIHLARRFIARIRADGPPEVGLWYAEAARDQLKIVVRSGSPEAAGAEALLAALEQDLSASR